MGDPLYSPAPPLDEPRADLALVCVRWDPEGSLRVEMEAAAPVDPRTDPQWLSDCSYFGVALVDTSGRIDATIGVMSDSLSSAPGSSWPLVMRVRSTS